MQYRLIIFLLWLYACQIYATNLRFHNVNETFGISLLNVASVCKDDQGFVWASSRNGVIRLAGNSYKIYSLPFETHNAIVVKLFYHNLEILAFSNNGQLFRYNAVRDRFDRFYTIREFNIGVVNALADKKGNCWIATDVGLYRYSNNTVRRINHICFRYIAWYNDSQIIAATDKNLCFVDVNTMKIRPVYAFDKKQPITVTKLFYEKTQRKLWIGTSANGLLYYDFKSATLTKSAIIGFPKQSVLAIEENIDSSVLVGVDGHGVWKLDIAHDKLLDVYMENIDKPYSLQGNGVYDIYCDRSTGRIWVCTVSGGVSYCEQNPSSTVYITHQLNNSNSLCNNHVNRVIEDKKGNLWIATDNGISNWDHRTDKWRTFYSNKPGQAIVFLSICEDTEGQIWCGTYSSGIYVIDRETGQEKKHYTSGNSSVTDYVFDIFKDSSGDIWMGGNLGGVSCYLHDKKNFRQYTNLSAYAFSELSPGVMAIGWANGLALLNKQTGEAKTFNGKSPCQDVLIRNNRIWFGSNGNGLQSFDLKKGEFQNVSFYQSKLPSDFVNSLMDADRYLYLGTENGLYRFIPNLNGNNVPLLVVPNMTFNRRAHCKLRNGYLVWGTNQGIVIVNPELLKTKPLQGKIFIQDIVVSGTSIRDNHVFDLKTPVNELNEISLSYAHNNLTMDLLPLGNTTAGTKFSWMMEGVDARPTPLSDNPKLNYTNIPVGKYVLTIKMYDSSFSQLVAERKFIVKVTPPFWGTWWFRLILFALVVGVLYMAGYLYINRLKQRHAEDKMRFFTNMAHEIRTSITLIKSPLEELTDAVLPAKEKYYLDLAAKQTRRLSASITNLLDFHKADIGKDQLFLTMTDIVGLIKYRLTMFETHAASKNIKLIFSCPQERYEAAVDYTKVEQIVDNLVSNAIKYSHLDNQVLVSFSGDASHWELNITDYGIGISTENQRKLFRPFYRADNATNFNNIGTGIGLALVKNNVLLHDGEILCRSDEDKGTTFRITVPYKKVASNQQNEELSHVTLPDANESEGKSGEKMRLLIVEDNDDLRNFMYHKLSEEFDVSGACDGKQAWEIITRELPDMIVSDVMMPNMDGFELCRLVKSTYETSHIPVVLLTALVGKAEELHALGLGADSYLTKPFDMALVLQRIRSIIQNRKILRDKALSLVGDSCVKSVLLDNELNNEFITKATDVVWANISKVNFNKEEFASAMNVSTSLLYKKIKSLTDQSPAEFIKIIRLNYALKLLREGTLSVTEISELAGFSSPDYFGKAFRRHFGKAPSEV